MYGIFANIYPNKDPKIYSHVLSLCRFTTFFSPIVQDYEDADESLVTEMPGIRMEKRSNFCCEDILYICVLLICNMIYIKNIYI